MSNRLLTIWALLPHTAAKHSVFQRHLEAWFPKLSWSGRVKVIDGFAGPGEYSGGEPGSPIIALNVASTHRANLSNCSIEFVFIEKRPDRFQHLEQKLAELTVPRNISIEKYQGSFKDVMTGILDRSMDERIPFPPSFVMIDPFGFEGVPMKLIARIAAQPRSEVLISFMYDSVTRWLSDTRNSSNFDELFGSPEWRKALTMNEPVERRDFLRQLYAAQLEINGWRYTRTFEMRDEGDRTEYFLVVATNSLDGLKVMKEAMWKVDPSGNYTYSDATDPRQLTLFKKEPDFELLRGQILNRFSSAGYVAIEELEEFVVVETAFRQTHYKEQILAPMEKQGQLKVLDSPRKTSRGYPDGTIFRFTLDRWGDSSQVR